MECFNRFTYCRFYLTDCNVNTNHILIRLVQNSVNRYCCFTSLTVSDNKLTLTSSNWYKGIDRFNSSLKRSEEHTSELQSRFDLVCRLLLEINKFSVYLT